jgi:hypothetical protein
MSGWLALPSFARLGRWEHPSTSLRTGSAPTRVVAEQRGLGRYPSHPFTKYVKGWGTRPSGFELKPGDIDIRIDIATGTIERAFGAQFTQAISRRS